jgi:hypothetical protein
MGEAAATKESWQQPSAAKRYTFTDYKPFTKDSPLLESGLLGPVMMSSVTPRQRLTLTPAFA